MRTLSFQKILSLASITAVVGTLAWWHFGAAPAPQNASSARGGTPQVVVAQVAIGKAVELFEAVGTVKAVDSIVITPKITGFIQTLHVQTGQDVQAGAPLITLVADERKADTISLAAQLKQAEAKREDARKQYERGAALAKEGYKAQGAFDTLKANALAAEQAVVALKAQSQMAQVRLEDTMLRAPFAGVVGIIDGQAGTYIAAGTRITTLTQMDKMKVEISLPERAVGALKMGMTANVAPITQPNAAIAGTVQEIDSEVNPTTRQVRLNIIVPNDKRALTQGMSVLTRVEAAVREQALLVPEEAVIGDGLRYFVFTVDSAGKVSRKMVGLGVRSSGNVEVLSGLATGEQVVVEGHQKIRHGQQVKIVPKS